MNYSLQTIGVALIIPATAAATTVTATAAAVTAAHQKQRWSLSYIWK